MVFSSGTILFSVFYHVSPGNKREKRNGFSGRFPEKQQEYKPQGADSLTRGGKNLTINHNRDAMENVARIKGGLFS